MWVRVPLWAPIKQRESVVFYLEKWDSKRSGQFVGRLKPDHNADKKCPVDIFYDAACLVPLWAPITNQFELQIQKSISKMVDFFVCEKIICFVSVCIASQTPPMSFDGMSKLIGG